MALQRPAWNPTNNNDFPPAFRAAVRACLLVAAASAARSQFCEHEGQVVANEPEAGCCLGDLPRQVLGRVVGLAAYPLSTWL